MVARLSDRRRGSAADGECSRDIATVQHGGGMRVGAIVDDVIDVEVPVETGRSSIGVIQEVDTDTMLARAEVTCEGEGLAATGRVESGGSECATKLLAVNG